jgi:hypothetical protein
VGRVLDPSRSQVNKNIDELHRSIHLRLASKFYLFSNTPNREQMLHLRVIPPRGTAWEIFNHPRNNLRFLLWF